MQKLLALTISLFSITAFAHDNVEIDYVENVAPILIEQCQACHREGGIAPWAMSNYQVVQGFAPAMREAIVSKRMPPGQINPKYADVIVNHRTLSHTEEETLLAWIDAGAPVEGDRDPLTETVYSTSEWVHGEPDMIIEVPAQEIPAVGTMGPRAIPYRYVSVDLGLTEDKWLRGSEFLPSEPTVMHHMLNTVSLPGERNRNILGASGEGQGDMDYATISAYVPGGTPDYYDENTGGLLRAGSIVNLQLHYTPDGTARTDKARIGLYFHDEGVVPEERMAGDCACIFPDKWTPIPPYDPNFVQTAEIVLENDINLHTFLPHMHFRGKSMKATAFYPDGTSEELIDIPKYDYAWQLSYTWREPKFIPKGTRLFVEGAFDNSAENPMNPDPSREVPWGQMSTDEMFFGAFTWKNLKD
jgi:hypothetical protein